MQSKSILYLPGRVSRIIVSALFLSSSLMITIDRWSRMVGYKNPLASSKTSWTQITGGEILSEILTPGNFGSDFISLCHHLLSGLFVVDWWPLIRLVYVPDVCWDLTEAKYFSQDDNCVTFEFGVTRWRHVRRLRQEPITHSLCVTLGLELRLQFAKL